MKNIKFTIITVLLITSSTLSKSQNSAIFNGGIGDGWSNKMYAQLANNIFNGGIGDGWASKNYAQLANNIFNGGIGDGWASDTASFILTVGIEENFFGTYFSAYPSPTNGTVNIDLGITYAGITTEIYNLTGQLIFTKKYENTKLIVLNIDGAKGTYFIKVISQNQSALIKVLKQ